MGFFAVEIKSLVQRRYSEEWYTVDFNPRSRLLVAAGCQDRKARLLDAASGAEVAVLDSHQGPVTGVRVCSLDAVPYLATCALDGSVLLWSLAFLTGPARPYSGHPKVEKRPLKAVSSLDVPLSCLTVAEVFGALRVFAGCQDATAWMWTIEAKIVMNEKNW